jgi:hypothetical protein
MQALLTSSAYPASKDTVAAAPDTALWLSMMTTDGQAARPACTRACETAREFNLPLLVDVAGRAHVVDMFAPQYPNVNFVIAHFGSFADDWRAQQQVVDQLVRYGWRGLTRPAFAIVLIPKPGKCPDTLFQSL